MRGKAALSVEADCFLGITPAHAGKRGLLALRMYCGGDHPRPCGEKMAADVRAKRDAGSPPPMRGKVALDFGAFQHPGITPAHAGKRLARTYRVFEPQDHPRPCGEKTKKTPKYRHFRFSSQSISFSFSYT